MEIAFRPISFHIKTAYKFIKRLSWCFCCCCYCTQMESIYFMLSFKSFFTSQRPATLAATCHPTSPTTHPVKQPNSQTALPCFALSNPPACCYTMSVPLSHIRLPPKHCLVVALPSFLAVELLVQLLRLRLWTLDFRRIYEIVDHWTRHQLHYFCQSLGMGLGEQWV